MAWSCFSRVVAGKTTGPLVVQNDRVTYVTLATDGTVLISTDGGLTEAVTESLADVMAALSSEDCDTPAEAHQAWQG